MFGLFTARASYIEFLYNFDDRVRFNKQKGNNRPYVGIVLEVNGYNYFAPLASPKKKYKKFGSGIDFMKIKSGEYGIINFNNMIPVPKDCVLPIDIEISNEDTADSILYKNLISNQSKWCNEHKDEIHKHANTLYKIIGSDEELNLPLKQRCCNFLLLEEKYKEYTSNKR